MPLPIDRLTRASATSAELKHMLALSEVEIESIAHRLEQVAETGVLAFVEEYRGLMVPEPEPEPTEDPAVQPEPEKPAEKPKHSRTKSADDDAS